jgi:hypothetical protein
MSSVRVVFMLSFLDYSETLCVAPGFTKTVRKLARFDVMHQKRAFVAILHENGDLLILKSLRETASQWHAHCGPLGGSSWCGSINQA